MQARSASNVKVIDVSHHQNDQGPIDWKMVKAGGVAGAFIKATEGGASKDLAFPANAFGAAAAGLETGFYHYAHPELNSAVTEAAHFANVVKDIKADFPHALDVEGQASKIGAEALTTWCVAWLQEVERLTGHSAMIYSGGSFARTYLGNALGKWSLWIAHYGATTPMANSIWSQWVAFQYTSSGEVDGIKGNVDINAMEKAFFDKYAGIPGIPQPTAEDTIKVVVNDKLLSYGRMLDSHVFLPLRDLGKALGANVEWSALEAKPYVDGKAVAAFQLIDGRTYVGIRSVAELLGGQVSWDGMTQKVYLYK
ncbi:glycoside hydrolase [Paenibacillus sp. MWE-103]|uniref:Glycoside hydrolase n=1 Tax=Paenibacillus artemisiicola TaxID=1172618 RepID=A0ABS3WG97_9BACL|nr:GH25 family lysozyme [Paenibacillus artemisiicola]MBO7747339.1 glycoside hydrolase [Paenibacillus artemisiicola]